MENNKFKEVKDRAIPYIPSILQRVLPGGRMDGNDYIALNPTRVDNKLGSFRINVHKGKWIDWSSGDSGGDIISLIAYISGISQYEALQVVESMIGGRNG